MSKHYFTVRENQTYLDDAAFLVKGLRCSNALISDEAAGDLIANLDGLTAYGINTVSVFLMGSRFGDVKGYREDGSLDPTYAARLGRIIHEADKQGLIVLVGCLYWGDSRAKWESWTQVEAEAAVRNTVVWLAEHDHRNTFVDVDNEGMARRHKSFDNQALVLAAKTTDPSVMVGTNYRGDPPPEADLALHFSNVVPDKPYIESEGSPKAVEGGYWGPYSNPRDGSYNYTNVGLYSEAMKASQKAITRDHLDHGKGYMLASTWLQAPPPLGPNHHPGGDGAPGDPGIRWWLEFLKENYA